MAPAVRARTGPPGRPPTRRRRLGRGVATALTAGGVVAVAAGGAPALPRSPADLVEARRHASSAAAPASGVPTGTPADSLAAPARTAPTDALAELIPGAPASPTATTPPTSLLPADSLAALVPNAPAWPTVNSATTPALPVRRAKPPDPLAAPAARARRVTDTATEWASFTLLDRRTGRIVGDARSTQRTNSESVVKVWIAADLLRTAARQGRTLTAYERRRLAAMIRLSDDNAAEVFWRTLGADASIRRMIATCRLTDTRVYPDWWSLTQISSRDMARLGACLMPGGGRPLDKRGSEELLRLMRTVDPSNAFGIQQAQPAGKGRRIAVKNGWTEHGGTGLWNVNCLGMWGADTRWVLAVTTRYPIERGLGHGAAVCRRVTTALFPEDRSLVR
jgi:hypothetical protein